MAIAASRMHLTAALACLLPGTYAHAGFDPQIGQPGSLGIRQDDPRFKAWATQVVAVERGPQDASDPGSPPASAGAFPGLISLGDGGSITLKFDSAIADGAGADFAVFENGFASGPAGQGLAFLELAFVEVSTDGANFFRFDATSLTQTTTQVGGFGLLDARDLNNLAGKHVAGYGTGFDLSELAGLSPLLDVMNINFIRIIDVVGSIDPAVGSYDSRGNLINDPFKTPFASSGFDLTGVGVLNLAPAAVPEPTGLAMGLLATGLVGLAARRRAG